MKDGPGNNFQEYREDFQMMTRKKKDELCPTAARNWILPTTKLPLEVVSFQSSDKTLVWLTI